MKVDGWKCDRCGRFFKVKPLSKDGVSYNVLSSTPTGTDTMDLCEECSNELRSWMTTKVKSEKSYVKGV